MRAMRILAPVLLLTLGAAAPEERRFMVSGFDRVQVDGPFQVVIVPKGAPGVRAGLPGAGVRAGGLPELPRITISAPRLRAIFVTGGGNVTASALAGPRVEAGVSGSGTLSVSGVDTEALSATLTGTGTLTLSGKAVQASFNSYGAGSVDASQLLANALIVRANGRGEGRYAARYTAKVSALGVGAIRVEGRPKCFLSGPGPISCGADDNIERR